MVRMRGVTTMGVGWASGEASDLVGPPLNLVIYMHLRIFAYTSNTLSANFEYIDCMLASGTLKNFRFLLRSCLFTERAPVMKLICFTLQPSHCIVTLLVLRRDVYWVLPVKQRFLKEVDHWHAPQHQHPVLFFLEYTQPLTRRL